VARALFYVFSAGAYVATAVKLVSHAHDLAAILGICAITLPVLAVSALSLAASFDLEARVHTFEETHEYLDRVRPLLDAAPTRQEFRRLVFDTEMQLLGETVNWASRRSFTSVT
jgi:hypothetical protein